MFMSSRIQEPIVFIGTYTEHSRSEGIYTCRLNKTNGQLTQVSILDTIVNPSFLTLHPDKSVLYSVSEVGSDKSQVEHGEVVAFKIDYSSGNLEKINSQSTKGKTPCHITVDKSGNCLLAANYGSGSIASYKIMPDGGIEEATSFFQHRGKSNAVPERQEGPHAHSVTLSPRQDFVFAADLGVDKIFSYAIDTTTAILTPNQYNPSIITDKGAGPRHMDFHPNGRFAYVINELSSTITAYNYDSKRGTLEKIHSISTLPEGWVGNNTSADIHVHPNGMFVYGSNRGHNSVVAMSIDQVSGRIEPIYYASTLGRTPRNFTIDSKGELLLVANQDSNTIVPFHILSDGKITCFDATFNVASPTCIAIS